MTEKEVPLPSEPYQAQNFKHEPEDEINLLHMLEFLVRKKALIFFTTATFVVLSIFYAYSVTPIYRATIGFQPSGKHLISFFPNFAFEILPNVSKDKNGALVVKNDYLLNKFIAELQSYANQEEVFIKGKFHERFVANNPKVDIKKKIVREIYRSIHVSRTNGGFGKNGQGLAPTVVHYDMKGINPELASDYLNSLADWVKNKVEFDVKELIQHEAKDYINVYSEQLNYELSLKRQENEDRIRSFTYNLEIAKNLGVLENNFDHFKPDSSIFYERIMSGRDSHLASSREQTKGKNDITWPAWYLYGQLALEQELNMMGGRSVAVSYSRRFIELNSNIEYLSNIDLSKMNLEPVIISQPSIPPARPINIKRMNIIAIGIGLGLFIGILIASLSFLMSHLKERSKLSPPEFM
jgi:LPS O-antigen subunit length determinant protein (WzzB/FepE family)